MPVPDGPSDTVEFSILAPAGLLLWFRGPSTRGRMNDRIPLSRATQIGALPRASAGQSYLPRDEPFRGSGRHLAQGERIRTVGGRVHPARQPEEEAARRVDSQLPVEEKKQYADYVIDTSGTLDDTERQVDEVWEKLQDLIKE